MMRLVSFSDLPPELRPDRDLAAFDVEALAGAGRCGTATDGNASVVYTWGGSPGVLTDWLRVLAVTFREGARGSEGVRDFILELSTEGPSPRLAVVYGPLPAALKASMTGLPGVLATGSDLVLLPCGSASAPPDSVARECEVRLRLAEAAARHLSSPGGHAVRWEGAVAVLSVRRRCFVRRDGRGTVSLTLESPIAVFSRDGTKHLEAGEVEVEIEGYGSARVPFASTGFVVRSSVFEDAHAHAAWCCGVMVSLSDPEAERPVAFGSVFDHPDAFDPLHSPAEAAMRDLLLRAWSAARSPSEPEPKPEPPPRPPPSAPCVRMEQALDVALARARARVSRDVADLLAARLETRWTAAWLRTGRETCGVPTRGDARHVEATMIPYREAAELLEGWLPWAVAGLAREAAELAAALGCGAGGAAGGSAPEAVLVSRAPR